MGRLAPDLPVVAVVLTAPLGEPTRLLRLPLPYPIPPILKEQITRWRPAQALSIFLQAVDIVNRQMTELRLKVDRPEVIIRPAVSHIPLLGNVNVHQVARLGEEAVEAALPALRRATSWPGRWLQRLRRRPRVR